MKYQRAGLVTKLFAIVLAGLALAGCTNNRPGAQIKRNGDEIMVAGQLFHTGAPVVLWTDPGGYDAYRVERRFAPWEKSSWEATTQASGAKPNSPNRLSLRASVLTDEEIEDLRGGGWSLERAQEKIDQFVLHYDVCGTSSTCFRVLHDERGLSVQFMLYVDGTLYQTCDLKERAWHATKANSRSVGVEIAHMGAYPSVAGNLSKWYKKDANGQIKLNIPEDRRKWLRVKDYAGGPARQKLLDGTIQQAHYVQYDFTPEQYESLTKLIATLCSVLPKIQCDYPKDENGQLITHVLPDDQYDNYQGVMGHYHVQENKQDPGPAMDWDRIINGARKLMSKDAIARMLAERGKPVKNVPHSPTTRTS